MRRRKYQYRKRRSPVGQHLVWSLGVSSLYQVNELTTSFLTHTSASGSRELLPTTTSEACGGVNHAGFSRWRYIFFAFSSFSMFNCASLFEVRRHPGWFYLLSPLFYISTMSMVLKDFARAFHCSLDALLPECEAHTTGFRRSQPSRRTMRRGFKFRCYLKWESRSNRIPQFIPFWSISHSPFF